ncbi:MAG: TonB-dependent receptor [Smithella sp.]|jgi:iron complex outermembrane receptor protein
MRKRYLILLFLIVFSVTSFAEEKTLTNTEDKNVTTVEEKSPAKTEDKDMIKLKEIVVTATRTEKEVEKAPGSVNVVTQKAMETRNIKTVDEALDTLPGVYNRRQSITDTQSAILLHGMPDQKRTLILKDGIILNNGYDGSASFTGLSTENIEKIEVVQGPFSSLYGGNAMGGVVNIITKMPEKMEFVLQGGYGSSWNRGESLDDLQKYYVSYGDKLFDKFHILLNYGYKSTNGFGKYMNVVSTAPPAGITGWSYTSTTAGDTRYLIGDKGDNTWWDDNIGIKAQYDFSSVSKISASFAKVRYKYNYDDPYTYLQDASGNPVYSYTGVAEKTFVSYTGAGAKEVNQYNVNFETEVGIVKTKLSFGLNDEAENWYTQAGTYISGGTGGTVSSTPNQNYNADIQFTLPLFNRNILTFGGSFKQDKSNTEKSKLDEWKDENSTIELTNNYGGKDMTYAVFVQDEILILDNLTAYIGFREDWWETKDGYANQFGTGAFSETYDSRSDSAFSPKLAVVYKPLDRTVLRASAGQAFRGPTVYEMFGTYVSGSTTYSGNPDLNPETVRSWDAGVAQGLWKGAKVSATYFENYMKDLIYTTTISPTEKKYMNVGKAETKGVMLEIEQRFDKYVRLFVNYTYTDARVKENTANPSSVDKRLTYIPDTMINAGAECEIGPVSASLTGRYVGKRYSSDTNTDQVNNVFLSYDPFLTMDAKVSYKVTEFATVFFSVDNIADESYFSSYLAPGRSWFSGLEIKI